MESRGGVAAAVVVVAAVATAAAAATAGNGSRFFAKLKKKGATGRFAPFFLPPARAERGDPLSYLEAVSAFVALFLYASFFEWTLHRFLMHTRVWTYPFKSHAVIHHGMLSAPVRLTYCRPDRIIKNIRFAWWNAPLIIGLHAPVLFWIGWIRKPIFSSVEWRRSASTTFFTNIFTFACMYRKGAGSSAARGSPGSTRITTSITSGTLRTSTSSSPLADFIFGTLIQPSAGYLALLRTYLLGG
jgi:hypothetical protein